MAIDHFENVARYYGEFRPHYPARLFELIACECSELFHAWDCATGSGQAAVSLAKIFDAVTATDASTAQLSARQIHPNVTYRLAPAHSSGLPNASIDAITVAQALHWLPLEDFFHECERVLKPGGILAAWCYGTLRTNSAFLNSILQHYYQTVVGPYWPPERALVDDSYRSIKLPFEELTISKLALQPLFLIQDWDQHQLIGYLRSWSASGYFFNATGQDPIMTIRPELDAAWGQPSQKHKISWPITLRMAKKANSNT